MPLPRVCLRTLMLAVAVVGFALGAGVESSRLLGVARLWRQKACHHAEREAHFRKVIPEYCRDLRRSLKATNDALRRGDYQGDEETARSIRHKFHRDDGQAEFSEETAFQEDRLRSFLLRTLQYHENARRQWERAARYPWLPVPPDPPMPK